ncbi:Glycosyltransferase involved in cell wall bisynthesis [Malonomonas rubra DSM 5091]|uniref:Glycosyltransferase involved in cell wall bisynthesis n=1 Tax=Malonomonas rubra DSM 5091 TaxID=1122189 RepID=A0A1M6KDE2_MALRU|nr:glycosyltransferase [Malonomonas rubra]SHJ56928.1 Glycosyltransferase involved in cell wall bisynthesis [Malonomonas rubra DSM 5091]
MNSRGDRKALRVALVLSELRPGGMERLVVHLATELHNRKIPVQVICLQGLGELAYLLAEKNVPVLSLESHGSKDFSAILRLRKELKKFQPSVINMHDYASLPYVSLGNLLSGRSPLLFTAHGLLYEGFASLQKRNRFFSFFLKGLSAVSEKVSVRHREYLDWKKPIQVIANGVPEVAVSAEKRKFVRDELDCTDSTHLFLAVGNPRPEKGFEDLLAAASKLRDKGLDFLVAIAGTLTENDYCRNLQQQLVDLKLEQHCRFLGFRDDTAALYSAADSFVLSSRSEGLPMVILEAMTAGLPVVATAVGGIPDAVGDHVLLVDAEKPDDLADAMQRIAEDEIMRKDLAEKGKFFVKQNFGVERMVDQYLEWYKAVLSAEC